MFKRTEEINNLFNCIQKKTYMAVNLYSTDNVLVKNLEETLKSDMGEKAIFIDIAKTEGFVGFVQEFII